MTAGVVLVCGGGAITPGVLTAAVLEGVGVGDTVGLPITATQ